MIFENLDDAGMSFRIYFQNLPSTLAYENLWKLKYLNKFHLLDLDFKRHANQGKLSNYVVLELRYFDLLLEPGNDDHPSHDVYQGQMLIKEVYEMLRSWPQWNETLFIITYDEHSEFYDHVPTLVTDVRRARDVSFPF
ncbi:Non-specific phospholipase C4, partial [Cucurbita argyrosperma subsp. sororia]